MCQCFNLFLLDTSIELTPTIQANATVFFSANAGSFGHYLLEAQTSQITLFELLQFIESVSGVTLPVSAEDINRISGNAYTQIQIYATPTQVTIKRLGQDVVYPAGFRVSMQGSLFGLGVSVSAAVVQSTATLCSICQPVTFPDLQFSFLLQNLNLGSVLLNPLGLSDMLIGEYELHSPLHPPSRVNVRLTGGRVLHCVL